MFRQFLTSLFVVALALPAAAQQGREDMLVSTQWLQQELANVKLVDVGDRAAYEAGHIPGAVLIEVSSLLTKRDGVPNELPPVAELEDVFARAGIGARDRIILYSRDPIFAARAWFTLDYLGAGKRAAILDGGIAKWTAERRPTSSGIVRTTPGSFEARVVPESVTRLATMRELVRLRDAAGPSLALIDARSRQQFDGTDAGAEVSFAGHIPGAVNVPFALNFIPGDMAVFRSARELRDLYARAGISRSTANVVYCRTGMQASVTYFVLKYLGYDASLYDGSYLEWSNAGEMIADAAPAMRRHEMESSLVTLAYETPLCHPAARGVVRRRAAGPARIRDRGDDVRHVRGERDEGAEKDQGRDERQRRL